METTLKTTSNNTSWITKIEVDNSTEHKDFIVEQFPTDTDRRGEPKIQHISLDSSDPANPLVRVGTVNLNARETQLLKDFLNQ